MPKDGRDLQKLITAIERARAARRSDLRIQSPAYLVDKVTGTQREHDVLLTYKLEHHEVVMALECRDRSRPIGIDAVEAFHTKCENTGIHRGIMVSAKGFTKPAKTKAAFYNIGCLTLDAVERFDWCRTPGLYYTARHITHTHFGLHFPVGTDKTGKIVLHDGRELTRDILNTWTDNIFSNHSDKISFEEGHTHQLTVNMPNPPLFMVLPNERVPAVFARVTIDFIVKTDLAPFSFRKYADAGSVRGIAEVAVATMPIGGEDTADIVLSTGADGITVSILANKK